MAKKPNKSKEELQSEYETLLKKSKDAKAKLTKFTNSLKLAGYFIDDNAVTPEKEVFGVFYEVYYYSHFDGHTSDPIYRDLSGANFLEESNIVALQKIISGFNTMSNDELSEQIDELTSVGNLPWEFLNEFESALEYKKGKVPNMLGKLQFDIKPDYLKVSVINEDADQGECSTDSYMEFRKATQSEIKGTRRVEKETRG